MIIKKAHSESSERPRMVVRKYHIDSLVQERILVYGELKGEHGKRVSTDVPRMYYLIGGSGKIQVGEEKSKTNEGDLIVIPPETKYKY